MALKDTWKDKIDGVDEASAKDINQVARAVIDAEDSLGEKIGMDELTNAIDSALEQAKESGEFDGERGDDGKSAYEYAQDGGFAGTEAEFAEKLAYLMGYSLVGVIGENNVITISGYLPEADYTVVYEMQDGSTVDIGALEIATKEPTNFFVIGGDGYLNPGRAASVDAADRTDVTTCLLSNYIKVQNGDIIYVDGMIINGSPVSNSGFYNTNKGGLYGAKIEVATSYVKDASFTANGGQFTINNASVGYIRICGEIPSDLNAVKITIERNGEFLTE